MITAQEARSMALAHRATNADSVLKDQLACIRSASIKGLFQCPVISRYYEMNNAERDRFIASLEESGFTVEFRTSDPTVSW